MRNACRRGFLFLALVSLLGSSLAACTDESENADLNPDIPVHLDQGADLTQLGGDGGLQG